MFIQAVLALISVCVGVYVFIMEEEVKGREYERREGGLRLLWEEVCVLITCGMRNQKRSVGMYMFISMLVTVKEECA